MKPFCLGLLSFGTRFWLFGWRQLGDKLNELTSEAIASAATQELNEFSVRIGCTDRDNEAQIWQVNTLFGINAQFVNKVDGD